MRTLIFGCRGQLGRDLLRVFERAGEAQGHDLPELDIADEVALQPIVEQFGPDLLINAAAYTNVDGAEDDMAGAFLSNETGARNVAELAAHHNIPVVYFSTDYVFDGTKRTPYTPSDPLAPLGVYGKSKAAGEHATAVANPRHFILRTAWLYGPGGNNFVEKVLQAAASRPELKVVEDEVGSPTHTLDLAEATLALARTHAYGIYHAVNRGACSRYEFARAFLEMGGVHTPVRPCASAEYPSRAERPLYSVLDPSALEAASGYSMRPWREALAHYLERRNGTG
ncbi:MAG: dTDP-4-dehydrorhamnose reductase [Candidatus Hydrogenedentes bacterium]|nr:dTDP-4-dehydrorhamnose reductase [Candidatus Hydrogenedentota bacterium]